MSELYNIDFEAGNFSEWDNDSSGAQLFVSSTGAISGTYSCNSEWKSGAAFDVSNDTGFDIGAGVTTIRTGCKIKLSSLNFGSTQIEVGFHNWQNGSVVARIALKKSGGSVLPSLTSALGSSPDIDGGDIDDGAVHTLEYRIVKESGAAAGDGIHEFFVDGVSVGSNTSVNNFAAFNSARLGIANWFVNSLGILSGAGHSGGVITDDWILRDDNTQIYPVTGSHIWLSTDGGATYSDIGDTATWGANLVGGVVVVPGTAYQTIFAAVGTSLYKTVNGGGAWTLETAVGYEVDFIDLEKDNTTVFLAKRDAAGANRASLWDSVGASLSHINTGKSTTGGATSGGDVV